MEWRAKKKAVRGTIDKPVAGGAAKKEEAGGFKELAKEAIVGKVIRGLARCFKVLEEK